MAISVELWVTELQRCKTFVISYADDGSQIMREVRVND